MPLSKLCQSPVKPLSNFLTAFWQCAELGFRARPPVKTSTVKTGFDSFWQSLTSFDNFWQHCQKLSKPGLTAFWQGCQNLFDSFWQRFDRAVKTCQSAVLIGFDSFWQLCQNAVKRCQKSTLTTTLTAFLTGRPVAVRRLIVVVAVSYTHLTLPTILLV